MIEDAVSPLMSLKAGVVVRSD